MGKHTASNQQYTIILEVKLDPVHARKMADEARKLGYSDLKAFLQDQIDKALFALTISPDTQIDSLDLDELEDINLNEEEAP